MTAPLTVIGTPVSPYVRKVLAVLELKGLAWRIDPLVPFLGNDTFTRLSPLRRIPVLIDGDLVLSDSSVICEYLDERHPGTALMPRAVADRARCRWLAPRSLASFASHCHSTASRTTRAHALES